MSSIRGQVGVEKYPQSTGGKGVNRETTELTEGKWKAVGWFAKEKMVNRVYAVPYRPSIRTRINRGWIFEKDELLALSASIAENGCCSPFL